jgi:hypothetical protein
MSTDRARLTGTLAWGVVGVRGAVAAAFAAAPDRTMGELFGQDAGTTTRRWVARHYALRDAALGAGLARSLRADDGRADVWMLLGGLADLVDAGAVIATRAHKTPSRQRLLVTQMGVIVVSDLVIALALRSQRRRARHAAPGPS